MKEISQTLVEFKDVNKSTIFLYTLLRIKNKEVKPIGTYMNIENCIIYKDMNLICMFYKQQSNFVDIDTELKEHRQFDYCVDDQEYRYYVMDFSELPEVYKTIKNGQYSKLPKNAKTIINMSEHPVGVIGVNPELYYEQFSNEFNVSIKKLREAKELLSIPNIENETLSLSKKLQEQFE